MAAAKGQPDLAAVLAGTAAYVNMVQPDAGKKLLLAVRGLRSGSEAQGSPPRGGESPGSESPGGESPGGE